MQPGTIVTRDERLFVILAASGARVAVAPVAFNRDRQRAGDVAVDLGALGRAIAACGSVALKSGVWDMVGVVLSPADFAACKMAAERAAREQALQRFAPLDGYAGSAPSFKSGGRRVGSRVMA